MIKRPIIDTLEFAHKGQHQTLQLRSEDFSRLTEESMIVNDSVQANVTGGIQEDGKPFVDIEILSALQQTCQRCLGLFDLQINSRSRFIIASREDQLVEIAHEEQDVNTIIAEKELDLVSFVEDELLLALPMVPLHQDGECESPQITGESTNLISPFKGLR